MADFQICSKVFLMLGLILLSFSLVSFGVGLGGQPKLVSQVSQISQTGGNADADRIFQVSTDGKILYIDGQPRPALRLKRGRFYIFRLDETMKGYPFYISLADDGGGQLARINWKPGKQIPKKKSIFPGEYREGTMRNRAMSGDVTLVITRNTPRTLYYHSARLPYMGNTIYSEWDETAPGLKQRPPQWRTYYLMTASQNYNLPYIMRRKGYV